MAFIPEKEAGEIRARLALQLEGPVTMDFFTKPSSGLWVPGQRECETCADTQQLLEEAAALSDQVTLASTTSPPNPRQQRRRESPRRTSPRSC